MNEEQVKTVAIMITTRDRAENLRATLSRLVQLEPQPDEIIVCADGCTDDTASIVRSSYPHCRLIENESQRGSVFSRDRMLRSLSSEIVISLDDDSFPLQKDFVERVARLFEKHPEVAVFSFPEIRDAGETRDPTKTPEAHPHLVSAYANCAAAMRRSIYLRSGGYPIFFYHAYEEPDYALQCYGVGYSVCFEPSLRIRHLRSPLNRRAIQTHHLNARNELWSVFMRCPFPQLIPVALFRIWRQFRYALSEGVGWAFSEWRWWLSALGGVYLCVNARQPISWQTYYYWMKLARSPQPIAGHLSR